MIHPPCKLQEPADPPGRACGASSLRRQVQARQAARQGDGQGEAHGGRRQTLYQLMSSRMPSAMKQCADQR